MSVTEKQVGGSHYTDMAIQPWEIIERNGLDFFEGSALAYLLRYKRKGGAADLRKAIHYLEYLIEREERHGQRSDHPPVPADLGPEGCTQALVNGPSSRDWPPVDLRPHAGSSVPPSSEPGGVVRSLCPGAS